MTEQRREDRNSLFLSAAMRLADRAEPLRIKVRNLSPGGLMAECAVPAECGARLRIDLRNLGWIAGTVSWVVEDRFGVTFDRDIDCEAMHQPEAIRTEIPM